MKIIHLFTIFLILLFVFGCIPEAESEDIKEITEKLTNIEDIDENLDASEIEEIEKELDIL